MGLILVGGIYEDQTRHAIGVVRRKDAHVETTEGRRDEHDRYGHTAAIDQSGKLAGDAARCPG